LSIFLVRIAKVWKNLPDELAVGDAILQSKRQCGEPDCVEQSD
jgi:hypothetical protein